jgi:3-hydroxyisobutyrate dehydrogenase
MATDSRGENVRVAVLGTGIMGSAMARNLVSAGLPTTVWERSPTATAPLSEAGALVTVSPAEAARDAHVVITMLPTADVVNSVIFAGGVVEALAEGAVWAQMGTIGLAATTEIGSRLGQLRPDVLFVDAPVSGSKAPPKRASCSSWHPDRLQRPWPCARCLRRSAARPCGWARPGRAAG